MAEEEDNHRQRLIDLHRTRFGDVIPLIRREHVAGWYARRPVWLIENLGIERIREEVENMESEAEAFYIRAAAATTDAATRKLLGDLAKAEAGHRGQRRHAGRAAPRRCRPSHRGTQGTAAVPPDLGSAGARGADGRLGLDARADLRHRLRDPGHLDDLPRRSRGFRRRGDIHGLHRGRVG
jgi:hypothetical protein